MKNKNQDVNAKIEQFLYGITPSEENNEDFLRDVMHDFIADLGCA